MPQSSLQLVLYPEKILSTPCVPVPKFTEEIQQLADQMLDLMYRSNGVGLAAPQVGQMLQLICVDVSEAQNEALQLINPSILQQEGCVESTEGCLSIPGLFVSISRAKRIQVSAKTPQGPTTFWAEGLLAICLQHEIDHLHGKIMLDHLTPFKRARALEKFQKHHLRLTKQQALCPKN